MADRFKPIHSHDEMVISSTWEICLTSTLSQDTAMSQPHTKRVCQIIKLRPSAVSEYKTVHNAVWPGVLARIKECNIVDYSIHHYPPLQLLIATFKYTGNDYEGDMKKMADDPETRRWWAMTDGMQESFVEGATGSGGDVPWWQEIEEVFRFDPASV